MLLVVPAPDPEPWPTLGPQVCDFIEDRLVYGPGSLQGLPYSIDPEFRAWLYRCYEVYPQRHRLAGRRRFKRCAMSVRKGLAKTEKEAIVVGGELHPEGPVRCDGFDAYGRPVGRPVMSPYIPMMAYSLEQVEDLAYSVLRYILEHSNDADLFDISLERIIRLDEFGREDGKALPLAQSPDSRDGARTTLNAFDEPHRLYLPRHKSAHNTMDANLPKRPLEDPWSLYVGTAGEPGQGSVQEDLHTEALNIRDGVITEPRLFYFYRTDNGGHDMSVKADRVKAIAEATGPAGEWGPGQFEDIADQWDRVGADKSYLERVWLNRWLKSDQSAFDLARWQKNIGQLIRPGAAVTVGFDGARFRDSTGFVVTDLLSGVQRAFACWERPEDVDEWEIPEQDVTQAVEQIHRLYKVVLAYGDPPHWTSTMGDWCGKWPVWREWWTNRERAMCFAVHAYTEGIGNGTISHEVGRPGFERLERMFESHVANAGKDPREVYLETEDKSQGQRLFVLKKIHPTRKFDLAMAAVLSNQARLDALSKGLKPQRQQSTIFGRIY